MPLERHGLVAAGGHVSKLSTALRREVSMKSRPNNEAVIAAAVTAAGLFLLVLLTAAEVLYGNF